jgi:hypothetical protein
MQGANKRTANAAVSGPDKKGPHAMPRPQGRPPGKGGPYVADPERVATSRRENILRRYREPDDPELLDAIRARKTAALVAQIRKVVDAAPPLTDDQKARLAALLRPGGEAA